MTEPRPSRRWHFVLVGLIVVGVATFVVLRGRPVGDGNGLSEGTKKNQADPIKALSYFNEALALLENGESDAAADVFRKLHQQFPDEPSLRRNWAIASFLAISPEYLDRSRHPEKFSRGRERAIDAAAAEMAAKEVSPFGTFFMAQLMEFDHPKTTVVDNLEIAAQLSNGDPAFEVEVYLASRVSDDESLQQRGLSALQRAGEKVPDNLWLLTELVVAQATAKDADVTKAISQLRESSHPFVEFVKKLRNVDLLDLLDKANAAVEANDWNAVVRNVRLVSNLLKPEIATKLDQRRLVKHPLEYVVTDFSAEWHAQHAAALAKSAIPSAAPIEVTFAEAAAADQLPPLAGIRDVKIADFDLDGRWDVVVLLSGQIIVYGQSLGKSKSESRWSPLCEAVVPSDMTKLLVCDLDRDTEETPDDHRFVGQVTPPNDKAPKGAAERAEDADPDVLVYGHDGVQFLRNQFDKLAKTRALQVVAQDPTFEALRDVLAIAPADIDHDGDLDLVVSSNSGMSIWQNNDSREHTKFTDISSRSALPPSDLKPTVLLPVDWNFDVQTDVLVTGPDVAKPGWLENISHGRLRWRAWPESELHIANIVSLHLVAVQTQPLKWDLLGPRGSERRGLRLWDFNNDGQRDELSWDADVVSRKEMVAQIGAAAVPLTNIKLGAVTACEVADFDADGDEDVLVVTDQRAVWVRNDGGNKNGWLDLSIRADKDRKPQRDAERTNIHGVGSWLELRGTGLPEMPRRKLHVRIVEGQSTHFGLGSAKQVDSARIVWTNGVPQNILRPRSGEAIAAQQILKGSCPYIYTWDGEQWVFFTDCLWAAPIGLQLAEGAQAPCREWEYLKIDGDRLHKSNGEYRLMLTEELWEAAYFDRVRLLAVDHPADVEFFSNDKVGPASVAEFHLHPVRQRHTPISARDHRGRDVLERLAKRDERYLRPFDRVIQQGLTEEHFIELDLGKLDNPRRVTLFLTGWVFPTDTSINIGISQNPDLSPPKPPAIWVQTDEGIWREAISYIGFPGGKTKTIAVDVSAALGLGGREDSNLNSQFSNLKSKIQNPKSKIQNRVRIVTSMELYWDEMFFTVDEPPLEHTLAELPLLGADLRFRGFSARLPHPEFGPERYDASQITTEPQWPPMGGKFTRYGNVTELINQSDDCFAILGAGDAMTVRFKAVATDLPSGWKRDFIIHNVGYDKDADLNTIYGQFVEPLPFRAMRGYPDPTGQEYPDSPAHRDYLRRFQTREQNRTQFWR